MTTRFSTADIRALAAEELKYGDSNIIGRMLTQLLDDRDRLVGALTHLSEYNNFGDAFDMEEYAQKALEEIGE